MDLDKIKIWFNDGRIFLQTEQGEVFGHPLSWFPKLAVASESDLLQFELSPFGIHWPDLDEDLSYEGFKTFVGPNQIQTT